MNTNPVNLADNLAFLTQDIVTVKSQNIPLPIATSKSALLYEINNLKDKFFDEYSEYLWRPLYSYLSMCNDWYFQYINFSEAQLRQTLNDSNLVDICLRINDYAQIILQHSSNFKWQSGTWAFQQLVNDMWNVFISHCEFCPTNH